MPLRLGASSLYGHVWSLGLVREASSESDTYQTYHSDVIHTQAQPRRNVRLGVWGVGGGMGTERSSARLMGEGWLGTQDKSCMVATAFMFGPGDPSAILSHHISVRAPAEIREGVQGYQRNHKLCRPCSGPDDDFSKYVSMFPSTPILCNGFGLCLLRPGGLVASMGQAAPGKPRPHVLLRVYAFGISEPWGRNGPSSTWNYC